MRRILLTGGAGFIGHHVLADLLRHTDAEVVCLDRLDDSGTLNRIAAVLHDVGIVTGRRVRVVFHDLKAALNASVRQAIGPIDTIYHLAAGSHVDRSIADPMPFIYDNVVGTGHLLEYARSLDTLDRLVYFSTDEVFGPAPVGVAYREWDRYRSGNPYAATKAGAEELCLAWANTYGLPVLVTHCMNVFGERQAPEKFIPLVIRQVLAGQTVTIHADPTRTRPGSRFYIHARNVAAAVRFVLAHGTPGEKYNIVGEREVDNLRLASVIAEVIGQPLHFELVDFHGSRPGHDLRYALDGSRLAAMGWRLPVTFEDSLAKTVRWTVAHPEWR